MNLFKISTADQDSEHHWLFSHLTKTENEFNDDINLLFKKYSDEFIETTETIIDFDTWVEYIALKMPELGYKVVTPITWRLNGGGGLDMDNISWDTHLQRLIAMVGEETVQKAIAKEREVETKLFGF